MKAVWILAMAVGVVLAEANIGYHYKVPQNSYGLPSYQLGGGSSQFNTAFSSSGSGSFYKGYPGWSSGYNTGNLYSGAGFGSDLSSGLSSDLSSSLSTGLAGDLGSDLTSSTLGSNLGSSYYLNSGSSDLGSIGQPIYQFTGSSNLGNLQSQSQSSEYKALALEKYKNYYQVREQPAQVFKHFYVHAAPEEPEAPKQRASIVLPPPQKHYKIIFVKTPSESRPPQVVPVPQIQNEEKTIVYVLSKKPEETQDVIVPKVEQKAPSKPEVFFIKYKNNEDSQAVIDSIVKDYNNKGQSVSLANTGVGDGTVYDNSGISTTSALSSDSGLGSTLGLSSINENSGLGNTYVTSGLSALDNSGFGTNYDSSGLSGLFGSGFQAPLPSQATATLFGTQPFGITPSPAPQTLTFTAAETNASDGQLVTVSSPAPISSTASTIAYENINAIPTSQGVPHETYGPPKFRN